MEKRRDSKGRVLHDGESQRPDGRYMYRYTNNFGKRCTIYSWRLVSTDQIKEGQKDSPALRDQEKQIRKDIDDGIKTEDARGVTVDDLYIRFMDTRRDLRNGTREIYRSSYNRYIKPTMGHIAVANIKSSTIKKAYQAMLSEMGVSASTVFLTHCLVNQLFKCAVDDALIRSNPALNACSSLKKTVGKTITTKEPLTLEQQTAFVNYIYRPHAHCKLANLFSVLLGTGMRIGEALGLRWCDCDFDEGVIHINHTLSYHMGNDGRYVPQINPPKSKSGTRDIPMFDDVKVALLREREVVHKGGKYASIDGYTGFVFLNSAGNVHNYSRVYRSLKDIVASYNKKERKETQRDGRTPCYLPKISPHIFRHTFCTRMCENNINIKVLQDIMGHEDIKMTLGVYAKATEDKKKEELRSLNGCIKIL